MPDYASFDGSTHGVAVTVAAADGTVTFNDGISLTVRFRTSHTGSRGMLWSEKSGSREYYVDLNATGAGTGGIRFVGFDGGSNFFTPNAGVNVCDGELHTVTVVKVNASLHRWYLDGLQVGTDLTTSIGTGGAGSRYLGQYSDGTLKFTGEVECWHFVDAVVTLAEHQAIHAGGTPLDVAGNAVWYAVVAGSESWGDALAPRTKPNQNGNVVASGTLPVFTSDVRPFGLYDGTAANVRAVYRTSRLIQPGSVGQSDELIREIGNVYVADDGDYCLPYAGSTAAAPNEVQVHLATSSDGVTWTKQGVILSHATHGFYTEDAYVVEDGGTFHLLCENRGATAGTTQAGIAYFTSADGKNGWTLVDADILPVGGGGAFDSADVSSPVAWKEGATWHLIYEGRSSGDNGRVGYATASALDGVWTKSGSNPVLSFSGVGGSWYETSIVPDDVLKVGSTYYLLAHGNGTVAGGLGYRCGVFESSDLTSWAEPSGHNNPLTGTSCNTLMRSAVGSNRLIGVDESGANSQSVLGYEIFAEADGGTTVAPDAIAATPAVPTPVLRLVPRPAAVAATPAVPAATIRLTVKPVAVAATAVVPAASIRLTARPQPVAASPAVPDPSIVTDGGSAVTVDPVAASPAVPIPSIRLTVRATPVVGSASVAAALIRLTIKPSPVAGSPAVPTPTIDGIVPVAPLLSDALFAGLGETRDGTTYDDSSPNDLDGITIAGPTWTTISGRHWLNLNGSTQWAQTADAAPLDIAGPWTVVAWIHAASYAQTFAQIVAKSDGSGVGENFEMRLDNSGRHLQALAFIGGSLVVATGATALTDDTEYHASARYTGSALQVLLNGVVDGTTAASGAVITNGEPLGIGVRAIVANGGQFPFAGRIADVLVYGSALTAGNVAWLADPGNTLLVTQGTPSPDHVWYAGRKSTVWRARPKSTVWQAGSKTTVWRAR